MRSRDANEYQSNLPSVDHEEPCVGVRDDGDRLDRDRMLMVDPTLPWERKRHPVPLNKTINL